jgi:two-component system chemotaxis response regulator CheB
MSATSSVPKRAVSAPTLQPRDIIVIGGSAGAVEGVISIVKGLPRGLPAVVATVIHHSPRAPDILASILTRQGTLPAVTVVDAAPLEPGKIYVPAADRHLVIEREQIRTSRAARENRTRPAIDPLFRSAANAHGARVIGVLLSGHLDDGTAGLLTIQRQGGLTLVQDPDDAAFPSMPLNALNAMQVDHLAPVRDIPALLARAVAGQLSAHHPAEIPPANGSNGLGASPPAAPPTQPVALTCPTCHGALGEDDEAGVPVFRCHTGHAFATQSLLASQDEDLEIALWSAVRALQEKHFLLTKLIEGPKGDAVTDLRERHRAERERIEHHISVLRRMLETG